MSPEIFAKLEALAAADIELVPMAQVPHHFVFAREGFAALVEKRGQGFGQVGSAGMVTDGGFQALVWRDEAAFFVARGVENPATPEQIESLRAFDKDLRAALAR
jgi:hypothetical protein